MTGFVTGDGVTYFIDEINHVLSCPLFGTTVTYIISSIVPCCQASFVLLDGTTFMTPSIVTSVF